MAITYINPPEQCDVCNVKVEKIFYDAKTIMGGVWANMCPTCYEKYGIKLGTGWGQKYEFDGTLYVKVEG